MTFFVTPNEQRAEGKVLEVCEEHSSSRYKVSERHSNRGVQGYLLGVEKSSKFYPKS